MGTHGLDGTVKIQLLTDFLERFDVGRTVYVNGQKHRIAKNFWHKLQGRVKFKGLTTIDEAEALVGSYIQVPISDRPELFEDEFYAADLLGLSVVLLDGTVVGKVDEVVNAPAQDLLRIGKSLIPMVREFVSSVDVAGGKIVITPIPGLLEDL